MTFKKDFPDSDQDGENPSSDFEQMLNDSFRQADRKLSVGQKINAEVLSVGKEHIIVSTGTRYDGFVSAAELKDEAGNSKVKRGDRIDLYVTFIKGSEIFLSPNSGRKVTIAETRGLEQNAAKNSLTEGQAIKGTVKRLEDFGAFVEIAPGIEALAHVSELSWSRVNKPSDLLKVGDIVNGSILRIAQEGPRLKVSITLKPAASNPWKNLPEGIAVGKVVSGKVTRCMAFGAFVELQPGMEGLIPLSEMSATKRVSRADEFAKEGSVVAVLIKNIDPDAKRISLSLKDAATQAAVQGEADNMREYAESQAKRQKAAPSLGALGAKLQAAMEKKK
ncbi:MAG: S1 RNA-binding domain-containing protein [Bdellovibrionales bacterium]|nr:S1 RNA-binding domain-containing protein [Bdellovibrionales bacterium]